MSKGVEWVFVKELMQLNNRNNLDNPKEPAYKTGHSTETALPHIKNEIHLLLSCGKPNALVLLDLSTAFDKIDHTTLLNSLKQMVHYVWHSLDLVTFSFSHRFYAIKVGPT